MQHSYIDRYAYLDSVIHKLDSRIKIIISFGLIVYIVLAGPTAYLSFIICGSVLFFLAFISRIPFLFIFKKTLVVIPFVILISLFIPFVKKEDGVVLFFSIVTKSYLSMLSMVLLTSTTKFSDLLKGLERLKMPKIFIMIISFMYRYLFLIVDELQRMERAKNSRTFGRTGRLHIIRTLSNIAGVLFIRSYERAERVYFSMCSRGFNGEIKTPED